MAYNDDLKRAIQIAQSIAKEYSHEQFSPSHLMLALLHNEIGLASMLASTGKDIHFLREWAEIRIEDTPKSTRTSENPSGDNKVYLVMEMADLIAMQLSRDWTDPMSTFSALLKPNLAFTAEQLKSLPITQKELMDTAMDEVAIAKAVAGNMGKGATGGGGGAAPSQDKNDGGGALYKYCVDKTALAEEGKLDPIIGRDRETRMVAEILGRRTKPNVILVGEPGVGKTALVDGFALDIINKKVPAHLQNARVFELDLGSLAAGASYKGEIEDRVKAIIKDIKQYEKAILFIDEIHILLDSKGSLGTGVAQLLKPELARGEITAIGATTNEEYRQYVEADEAFNRRFEILRVEEPDVITATRMIQNLVPFYEKHHTLKVGVGTVEEAVKLSKRYVKDRRLPDAAVDLLDRTMAAIRMMGETSKNEIELLQAELEKITADGLAQESVEYMKDLRWFLTLVKNKVSHILLNQLESEVQPETLETTEALSEHLKGMLEGLLVLSAEVKESVEKADVAAVISGKTGIPLGKLQSSEREKLMMMNEILKKRVVGQDHAVKALCEAILESRSGLIKPGQPIGSFFLLGPTGTGKTELAKSLADFLFNDESFMIRFDMSEFKEEHSAALLYGAPPGYVGYEEGGVLINKIREKPYSVVLFDEIEKAHPSVYDIFLQIMDEGKVHDRLGKEGDFSNAVVLFTSNIGSESIAKTFTDTGVPPKSNDLMDIMAKHFRPEYLARLTEIVPFAPITEENVVKIFDIHLKGLLDPLNKQGIMLEITPEAKKQMALLGFTPKYGARPIKGNIRNQLRRPISKMIISGELVKGNTLSISKEEGNDELVWTVS
jgi:ATP-dependent Clp protease ATP-binding subunit ClpB